MSNHRLELLRKVVPHAERTNTACFLEEVINYIEALRHRNSNLERQIAGIQAGAAGTEQDEATADIAAHPPVAGSSPIASGASAGSGRQFGLGTGAGDGMPSSGGLPAYSLTHSNHNGKQYSPRSDQPVRNALHVAADHQQDGINAPGAHLLQQPPLDHQAADGRQQQQKEHDGANTSHARQHDTAATASLLVNHGQRKRSRSPASSQLPGSGHPGSSSYPPATHQPAADGHAGWERMEQLVAIAAAAATTATDGGAQVPTSVVPAIVTAVAGGAGQSPGKLNDMSTAGDQPVTAPTSDIGSSFASGLLDHALRRLPHAASAHDTVTEVGGQGGWCQSNPGAGGGTQGVQGGNSQPHERVDESGVPVEHLQHAAHEPHQNKQLQQQLQLRQEQHFDGREDHCENSTALLSTGPQGATSTAQYQHDGIAEQKHYNIHIAPSTTTTTTSNAPATSFDLRSHMPSTLYKLLQCASTPTSAAATAEGAAAAGNGSSNDHVGGAAAADESTSPDGAMPFKKRKVLLL